MDSILRPIKETYIYLFYTAKDPRAHSWPFTESPPYLLLILLIIYYLLIRYGPKIMKNRKPFELNNVMMVYNTAQVIMNTAAVIGAVYYTYIKNPFNWVCQPIDRNNDSDYILSYIYFSFKVIDLFDTVFIVLRKHNKQLSFLHCYHHFMMVCAVYMGIMWVPGGNAVHLGILNSLVHAFMYSYYFATAFNSNLKNSACFKRNITHLQIIQFLILSFLYSRSLFASNCNYPRSLSLLLLTQSTFMLYLFSKFYVKTYLHKKSKK